jgi:putative oxidoreductase
MLQAILSVLGRILLCAIFLAAAAGDIMKFEETTATVKDNFNAKLPTQVQEYAQYAQYAVIAAIVFSIAGSLLVITGFWARFGALLLFLFLIPATAFFHDFWNLTDPKEKQQQIVEFLKNLGLMGAMLFILANGAGHGRLGGRRVEELTKV